MTTITVYKLDHNGREVWQYPAQLLARDETSARLEAFFNRDDMDLGYTTFKRGDRFVETFYTDRWYNIFAIYDRDDNQLKGWYCNIARPAKFSNGAIHCEDLALDLWVTPGRSVTILDEDEFTELGLDDHDHQQARGGLDELHQLILQNALPR